MRRVLLVAALLPLAGCAVLDKLAGAPPTAPAPAEAAPGAAAILRKSSADELVTYLARLKGMSESALSAEAARQRQAAQRQSDEVARLKAAMALVVSGQPEEGEVLALVDPLTKKDGTRDADVRAMASFLQGIAHERRRLKESAAAAGVKLRDAQRARENEKQRAEALQERAAQLQQKLDALTDLEKSLSDRQTPAR
jgi:hypothetical protein